LTGYTKNKNNKMRLTHQETYERVQQFLTDSSLDDEWWCAIAASCCSQNYLDCLQLLHQHNKSWNAWTCLFALINGFLPCLQFAHENGCSWDFHGITFEQCMQYIRRHKIALVTYANIPKYYVDSDFNDYFSDKKDAFVENHQKNLLSCLEYAHKHGCQFGSVVSGLVADSNFVDCMKFLRDIGSDWDAHAASNAAFFGHLDLLKFIHRYRGHWNCKTTEYAASNGHLECLRYAHENGCEWNHYLTEHAAANGQIACLQYAQQHGCEITERVMQEACINKRWKCMQYCFEQKFPYNPVQLCAQLSFYRDEIDLDRLPFLRDLLFPYINTGFMDGYLNFFCRDKQQEINCQKEYLQKQYESNEISLILDLVNIVSSYL